MYVINSYCSEPPHFVCGHTCMRLSSSPPGCMLHQHHFTACAHALAAGLPPPPEVPPPADEALRKEADSLAALVARSGPAVEALARKQARDAARAAAAATQNGPQVQTGQPGQDGSTGGTEVPRSQHVRFAFLLDPAVEGAAYYAWRLYRIRTALAAVTGAPGAKSGMYGLWCDQAWWCTACVPEQAVSQRQQPVRSPSSLATAQPCTYACSRS